MNFDCWKTLMGSKYLESLTWLRAIAAFFVVVSHSIRASEVKYYPHDEASNFFPFSLLDLGTYGVYLFFALSGCTLYLSSFKKVNSIGDFGGFYLKRFMRIWPAFAISLLVYLLFIEVFRYYYFADNSLWIAQFLREYTVYNIFQYLSLTFNITGPSGLFNGPYWSLPVEFQYYLLLPFVLLFMKNRYLEFIAPVLVGSFLYYLYRNSPFELDRYEVFKMGFTFFGGVFLAKIYQEIKYRIAFKLALTAFIFVIVLAGSIRAGIVVVPDMIPFISDKWNVYGILALVSVALALFAKPVISQNRFLDFIHSYGEISYSIYLFHMIFIGAATLLLINLEVMSGNSKLAFILSFSLIGSYIFSKCTYRYIELPSITLGRRASELKKRNALDTVLKTVRVKN